MIDPCRTSHSCDITDGDDPDDELLHEKGCCTPIPVKRTCVAPILPTPECDEEEPIMNYDPETEEFTALTTLYDSTCSALADSNGSLLLSLIA